MASNRKIVLVKDEIYHVFNRGVEKRQTFTSHREYQRAFETLKFYRFSNPPIRLSKFFNIPHEKRLEIIKNMEEEHQPLVEIIAYCLMPNHFHFLLKQIADNGISIFISNFANSYVKYFNTKHDRVGPLFQGRFKAVHIEDDEQLIHISRYIHLNPAVASIIKPEDLEDYLWSSYPEYLNRSNPFCTKEIVSSFFKSPAKYAEFVMDQIDYAKKLDEIKHLMLE